MRNLLNKFARLMRLWAFLPVASFFASAAFSGLLVAILWLASGAPDSTSAVATVLSGSLLGASVAPFLFGVFADRCSARTNLTAILAIFLCVLAASVFALDERPDRAVLGLTAIGLALGFTREAWRPVWRSIVFVNTKRISLIRLNGANSASNRLGELAGSFASGLAVGVAPVVALALPVALLTLAVAITLRIVAAQPEEPEATGPQPPTADPPRALPLRTAAAAARNHIALLVEGLRYILTGRTLLHYLSVLILLQISIKLANLGFAPLVRALYADQPTVYGTMEACFSTGALVVALLLASPLRTRLGRGKVLLAGIALLGATYVALPYSTVLPMTFVLMVLMGLAFGVYVIVNTVFQEGVGEGFQGRCASFIHITTNLASILAVKATGLVSPTIGTEGVFLSAGALACAALVLWVVTAIRFALPSAAGQRPPLFLRPEHKEVHR